MATWRYVHAFISKPTENGGKLTLGHGSGTVIKYITPPPLKRKFRLLTGDECPQEVEESTRCPLVTASGPGR